MIRSLAALLALIIVLASAATAQTGSSPVAPGPPTPPPGPATPLPIGTIGPSNPAGGTQPTPAATTLPAAAPAVTPANGESPAAPTATPHYVQFTGQLLDVRGGFVYFTTGDAFPIVDPPRIIDLLTGALTTKPPRAKMFARATFDPATKKIVELAITDQRVVFSKSTESVAEFAARGTAMEEAPELVGQRLTGRQVAVVFEITAPPTTALTDSLYISTDASQWNPTAIKLDRVDAYRYRALRYFASGTRFAYRVTRGSWNSVERGEDNLDAPPHQFFVREVDALAARVTVFHWSDENPAAQGAGPNSIPTPYNPNPFSGGPGGISVPQIPTPQPTRHP